MTAPELAVAVPARLTPSIGSDVRVEAANRIFFDVIELVRAAGLDPVVVDDAEHDLSGFAGVVLPGGGDVDPARYGGEHLPAVYDVNPEQDDLDFRIAERALEAGLPVLGICRGFQVLNTVYGGSLHEDLEPTAVVHAELGGDELEWAWHPVDLAPGSALLAATGEARPTVASGHHQGVRRLGDGLRVAATAPDGLVEAFEDPERDVIGVQWHPEAEGVDEAVRDAPFRAFADAVRARAGASAEERAHV